MSLDQEKELTKSDSTETEVKENRDQKLSLVLTKKEKEEIRQKAKKGDRSLTNFIIKFLYDHGALTSEK